MADDEAVVIIIIFFKDLGKHKPVLGMDVGAVDIQNLDRIDVAEFSGGGNIG